MRTAGAEEEAEQARRRARVAQVQRARVLAALYEQCAQGGVGALTVGGVVARAGVSRRTFYEQFESVEQCLLTALASALERASERVLAVDDPALPWRARMRGGLAALLAFFDEQPPIARLLLVDSPAAGPRALALRERELARAVAAVAQGAGENAARARRLPPLTAEGAVGGVLGILQARVQSSLTPLLPLLNQLMSVLVLPYLGPGAAAAELRAPAPEPPPGQPEGEVAVLGGDPLAGLDMRLTYRTMRVLAAVAADPGCTNRAAGNAAGVEDQGQISKLLWRLERVGLIENARVVPAAGAPNAWRVTPRGRQLCETFAAADGRSGG